MESNLHRFTKRALLLSGGVNDKWPHNEDNNYDNSMRWVMDNALNPNGFERDFLFRVDGKTRADAISALQ